MLLRPSKPVALSSGTARRPTERDPTADRSGGQGRPSRRRCTTISSAMARRCSSLAWAAIRASRSARVNAPLGQPGESDLSVGLAPRRPRRTDRPVRSRPAAGRRRRRRPRAAPRRQLGRRATRRADARSRSGRRGRRSSANTIRPARRGPAHRPGRRRQDRIGRRRRQSPACPARRPRARRVGVDDDRAVLGQQSRHGALARSDSAGQPHVSTSSEARLSAQGAQRPASFSRSAASASSEASVPLVSAASDE